MPSRIQTIAVIAAAAAIALLVSACGGTRSAPVAAGPVSANGSCGGVAHCPYTAVRTIGRRGGGVLRVPEALAIAPSGEIYEGDQFSYVVQRFSPSGRFLGQWGSFGTGPGQFGSVGALAVDRFGDVYVLDSTNDRIEVFTADGRYLRSWGGRGTGLGQFSFGGGGRAEIPPGGGLAVSGDGVYVADSDNDRIERFSLQGTDAQAFGQRGSGPGQFADPRGLTVYGNELYVADNLNRRVQVLSLDGRFITQTPPVTTGIAHLADPYDVAVDALGELFVADDNNNRIVRYTPQLAYSTSWRQLGVADETIGYIRALAVGGDGAVYVADSARDRIAVFDRSGTPLRDWGISGQSDGQFDAPLDVSRDGTGGFLVIEGYGSRARVQRLDGSFAVRETWSGGGDVILGRFFFSPTAVAAAGDGSFWTTDQANGLIRHFSAGGALIAAIGRSGFAPPHFAYPTGIASAPDGTLYVADTRHGRVVVLTADGRLLGSLPRDGASLGAPAAVATGLGGLVYVADAQRDQIDAYSTTGALLRSWGQPGNAAGDLRDPDGVAVDARGDVLVADEDNDRIEAFTATGRLLWILGRPGSGLGELNHPGGLTVDCHGSVVVADTANNRLQVFAHAAAPTGRCSGG